MVDNKECFVICPIGEADSETREHSDLTYNYIIKPVVEEFGYSPNRADLVKESGMITTQIIEKIIDSPLVIADLTDSNPNVFYELAIRHVVEKPYIQMIKSNQEIPFDINGMRTILFGTDLKQADDAKKELRKHIESIKNNKFKPVNPVTHARSFSVLQKMLEDNKNYESGDINKIVLKSVSDMSSMMTDMRMDFQKLKMSVLGNNKTNRIFHDKPISKLNKTLEILDDELNHINTDMSNTNIKYKLLLANDSNGDEVDDVKNKLDSLLVAKRMLKHKINNINTEILTSNSY